MRTTLLSVVLMTVACGPRGSGVQRAEVLYQRGDYSGALRAADDELARSPEKPELWHLKMKASIRNGASATAVADYMKWHKLRRKYDPAALRAMAETTLSREITAADAAVRRQVLRALGELRIHTLDPDAVTLLGDRSAEVAATAAALLCARDRRARKRALELLESREEAARAIALAGLGRRLKSRFHKRLRAALEDPSPRVRRTAVQALARHPSRSDIARLVDLSTADPHGSVRAAALTALGRLGHKGAADAARKALADSYVGARLAGLALLSRRPKKNRAILGQLATSDDLFVALRASIALLKGGGEVPMRTFQWALRHRRWNIRVAALNAIAAALSEKVALGYVIEASRDERVEVRLAAARVLLGFGRTTEAARIFLATLEGPDDDARVQAAVDLLRMDHDSGLEALGALSKSPTTATRRAAARAHRYTDNPTLPLVEALGDPAAEVRVEAATTLLALLAR